MKHSAESSRREVITIAGIVQGVGFRPFVYRLAVKHGLTGFVRNLAGGVRVEVEGDPASLKRFREELRAAPPLLARIESIKTETLPLKDESGFHIEASTAAGAGVPGDFVSPDIGTCGECLAEVFDPANRRYRYPFTNCVNCGPRLTIIEAMPYDRERTTMSVFPMCPQCRAEYENPANRRFHAEPTACPVCGPRLELLDAHGQCAETADPLERAIAEIRAGRIGALQGLGGFHLICDAGNESAVAELRRRKGRDAKPFAIMLAGVAAVRGYCECSPREEQLLLAPERPIVLLPRRAASRVAEVGKVADAVAPGNPLLGVMLPYTPLHHLLMYGLAGRPLVVTSGNRADLPLVFENTRLTAELGGIADFFLTHNRAIHQRCDDSVWRCTDGQPMAIRRSRGFAPAPITLPVACGRPLLALGGQLKSVFALGRDTHAILSHHLGDLDEAEAFFAYADSIGRYERLFGFTPELLVHDLHPDYASTRYARQRNRTEGILCLGVQHHHAHIASGMAEHGLTERVIGVALDGTGYGSDGKVWGGEFLLADYRSFERFAHFRYVPMPGGDAAVREPWRMALAHLLDAGESTEVLLERIPAKNRAAVGLLIAKGFNSPLTSSCGRLFDAVAALIGVCDMVNYEGQAAIELEWLAAPFPAQPAYPFEWKQDESSVTIDTRPLISAIARDVLAGVPSGRIARRFHSTLAEIILSLCEAMRKQTGIQSVVLSGGVFLNATLTRDVIARLSAAAFQVYRQTLVPPNDGGLCLGQLAIAAAWQGGK